MSYSILKMIVGVKNTGSNKDERIASLSAIFGPRGIKTIDFLAKFDNLINSQYKDYAKKFGYPFNVKVLAFMDSKGKALSYSIEVDMPSVSYLLKELTNISKLSKKPGTNNNRVEEDIVEKIVDIKILTRPLLQRDKLKKSIIGTLKSCGLDVKKIKT
ncbi:50S ribosomal protein L11 [bacterium AB1]|nr:50S ribosomal protein L11 [bacterium AB1]